MKSATDLHWNERAKALPDAAAVNIHDIYQRELENEFIIKNLDKCATALEVGCGNGYSTNVFHRYVAHIDAFDYSEEMIARAKSQYGESIARFFNDNLLAPKNIRNQYDTAICVRVLINLRNLEEQKVALTNITRCLRKGGTLLLLEGFAEGFQALNTARQALQMPSLAPAKINFYSQLSDLLPLLRESYTIKAEFNTGAYDYFTRVIYPYLVGPDNVAPNTEYSEKFYHLAKQCSPQEYKKFARLQGFVLVKN